MRNTRNYIFCFHRFNRSGMSNITNSSRDELIFAEILLEDTTRRLRRVLGPYLQLLDHIAAVRCSMLHHIVNDAAERVPAMPGAHAAVVSHRNFCIKVIHTQTTHISEANDVRFPASTSGAA